MSRFRIERVPSTAVMYRLGEIKGVRIAIENSGAGSPLTGTLSNKAEVLAELNALIGELERLRERAEAAQSVAAIADP